MDKGILRSVEIDGEYIDGEFVDRIYRDVSLKPTDYFPKLKVFSIDIETSMDNDLYSIAIHSDNYEKVLMGEEDDILEEFKEIILEEDPDVLTGWNFIDFDLNLYQLFFMNGCSSYPYFNGSYFKAKGGSRNLEIITSGADLLLINISATLKL